MRCDSSSLLRRGAVAAVAAILALAQVSFAEQRATREGLTVLTEANWDSTLSHGAW